MGRRYRRRYRSSRYSLEGLVFLAVIGTLSQIKIETILFYGVLIIGVGLAAFIFYKRHKKKLILESGIDIIDNMEGVKFEELLLMHFQKQGYKGHLTPTTNDYGADLIVENNGQKTVVQAKRWKQTVGIEAVQQVIGAIKHYNATMGIVITNSNFTQQARNLAKTNSIEMWDRKVLISFMRKNNGREMAKSVSYVETTYENNSNNSDPVVEQCPDCGKQLNMRNGKNGKFWGCAGYPICRYTKELGA